MYTRLNAIFAQGTGQTKFKSILTWGFTFAVTSAIVYYLLGETDKVTQLLTVRPVNLIWLFGAWLLLSIPRALVQKVTARKLGVDLDFIDWYGLSMVTNLINMFVPARGDYLVSAAYLKKKYSFPFKHFGSMVYGNAVLLAVVLTIEGCVALVLIGITEDEWNLTVWWAIIAVGIVALPFALFSQRYLKGEHWIIRKLRTALEGWELLRSDSSYIVQMVLLIMASSFVFFLWMYVSYYTLDFSVRVIPLFFAAIATQMSFFFSLTPGNLGVREALVGFISDMTGLGFAEGVTITLLQRAVSTIAFVIMGGLFGLIMWQDLMRGQDEPSEHNGQHEQ